LAEVVVPGHDTDSFSNVACPLTARGLSGGDRPVVINREPCALFLGTRIDLLWTAMGLGFQPTQIHLRHVSLGPIVQKLAPEATIVTSCTPAWRASLPAVAFVQGYAHSFSFLFEQAEAVLCTRVRSRQLRSPPSGWNLVHTQATHAEVGGVTDGADHCIGWFRTTGGSPRFGRCPFPGPYHGMFIRWLVTWCLGAPLGLPALNVSPSQW
jgi:hypothetical protein